MIRLANGKVITRDPGGAGFLADGGVVTDGGKILAVGTSAELAEKYPDAEFVDAKAL
jgi:predicted amidohydrolase YtcJ